MSVDSKPEATDRELVPRAAIDELVRNRNRALELAQQALRLLVEAEQAARLAAPHEPHAGFLQELKPKLTAIAASDADEDAGLSEAERLVRRCVDLHAWRSLQTHSGLRNLMDHTATNAFHAELRRGPPPFTVENTVATYFRHVAEAPQIFTRSLVAVFENLDTRRYRSNSAFGFGPRIVIPRAFDPAPYGRGWNTFRRADLCVRDLDRLLHLLDQQKPPEAGDAADAIGAAYHRGESTCQTTYFEARCFRGGGSLHLAFRREDLRARANQLLARHFGVTLPDDRKSNAHRRS